MDQKVKEESENGNKLQAPLSNVIGQIICHIKMLIKPIIEHKLIQSHKYIIGLQNKNIRI